MTVKLWDFQGYECVKTMHGESSVQSLLSTLFMFVRVMVLAPGIASVTG